MRSSDTLISRRRRATVSNLKAWLTDGLRTSRNYVLAEDVSQGMKLFLHGYVIDCRADGDRIFIIVESGALEYRRGERVLLELSDQEAA